MDYDSNASVPSEDEDVIEEEGEIDDVFGGDSVDKSETGAGRKKIVSDSGGLEQLDPSSYTWGILRYAVVKIALRHISSFLNIAGLELQGIIILFVLNFILFISFRI